LFDEEVNIFTVMNQTEVLRGLYVFEYLFQASFHTYLLINQLTDSSVDMDSPVFLASRRESTKATMTYIHHDIAEIVAFYQVAKSDTLRRSVSDN
jgi:hypothetical protein